MIAAPVFGHNLYKLEELVKGVVRMSEHKERLPLRAFAVVAIAMTVGGSVYLATRTPVLPAPQPVEKVALEPDAPALAPVEEPAAPKAEAGAAESSVSPLPPPPPTAMRAEARPDLSGTWELTIEDEDGDTHVYFRIEVVEENGTLRVVSGNIEPSISMALEDRNVSLTWNDHDVALRTFSGTLDASNKAATGRFNSTEGRPGTASTEATSSYKATLALVPATQLQHEQDASELHAQRRADALAIYEVLTAFAQKNNGQYPSALNQIPASDFADPSLLQDMPGRSISYTAGGEKLLDNEAIEKARAEFSGGEYTTERVLAHEQKLLEAWGSSSPASRSLLRIAYDEPPLVIEVSAGGVLTTPDYMLNESSSGLPDASELRAANFNNMKQLMLVIKMFEAEHNGHIPGGWLSVYPEYLSDPTVLLSPWSTESEPSYELIQPGERSDDLVARAQELIDSGALSAEGAPNVEPGTPAWNSWLMSRIPVIVGIDELPVDVGGPPLRAVAFLDGHVEAVHVGSWDERITPFLR